MGDQLLTNASAKDWSTYNVSAKAGVAYRELTLTLGGSVTGDGNTIQAPWGSFPGYLSLIQEDFDRANEKAVLVGAAYDFSKLITPGLGAYVNYRLGLGRDRSEDAGGRRRTRPSTTSRSTTGRPAGTSSSPRAQSGSALRGVILDQQDADQLGWQVRFIINWEIPLL